MRAPRLATTLTAGGVAIALAACGSGGSSSAATGASDDSAGLAFAKCMRGHGFPHFPDPGGPRSSDGISILGVHLPPTTNIRAPAFQSGVQLCTSKATGGHPPPPPTAAQKAQALAFAKCMRAHGDPGFPDPVFTSNGGIGIGIGKGQDPSAPAFQHAQRVCGNP
jgi:hypothetical protein